MNHDHFAFRHTGPRQEEITSMLEKIGVNSLDELIEKTIPSGIRLKEGLHLKPGISEQDYLNRIREIASRNHVFSTYIGMGYYGTVMPPVIQRNILENPGWYTSYTPYQAEISQGRLEALLNFQTVVLELTGMEIANASLLDEGTAAAEAMIMLYNARSREAVSLGANRFFADNRVFPQTLDVINTRAAMLGIEVVTGDFSALESSDGVFGAMIQYPDGDGRVRDYGSFVDLMHSRNIPVTVAADLMSLVLLVPPGQWGADVVVGSTQRFGIPMNYGGPHAAFFATREAYKRFIPGRIIGVTIDRDNRPALRMALQTREQHIKRERATSNICTAQALLASMAGMFAVYHGPEGLKTIATRIHLHAVVLHEKLVGLGCLETNHSFFDTLRLVLPAGTSADELRTVALEKEINFRYHPDQSIGISLDETTSIADLNRIVEVFATVVKKYAGRITEEHAAVINLPAKFLRSDSYMDLPLFRLYRCETEMMRYIKLLERKDFSLAHGMIPLGSCTMKLNAAAEMLSLSWPEFGNIHPFVPLEQAEGYHQIFHELAGFLRIITGLDEVSFQPNSGAAGEYAGLLVIRKYLESRNENHRDVVLIPASAHGTNPASAAMAGMKVVVVNCDESGNIDVSDLKAKAELHKDNLAAFMVTYPSTHGVFESAIREMCALIHQYGGQVYMDGANMNAQVGLTNPASIGADVCHLNLHKTFAIPHGGGGPGAGPIVVAGHLVKFLPSHPVVATGGVSGIGAIAAAPWGSAGILTISHAYCCLLGGEGLAYATKIAILNANYMAVCLKDYFKVLYTGENGLVGHEMILDCRGFKAVSDVTETDIAKRLMDYGFHAPTLSFPVHGTLMVEPTESESLYELNRFNAAMISIYREIEAVIAGGSKTDNPLKNAPHTQLMIAEENWPHPYTRKQAAFPSESCEKSKFWPTVRRVDDAFGDRNLVCSCRPVETYR
jgi:glycine dehydrogenase